MRLFDNPGDLKDILHEIRRNVWKDIPKIDQALFLSLIQGAPAVYSEVFKVTSSDLADDNHTWNWWKTPADMSSRLTPLTAPRLKYFDGGIRRPPELRFNGWRFIPDHIQVEFFSSGRFRRDARISIITTPLFGFEPFDSLADNMNSARSIVAYTTGAAAAFNIYTTGITPASTLNILSGVILPTFLLIHEKAGLIHLRSFTGLIAGDFIKIQMFGKWFFDPRLLEEDITADD